MDIEIESALATDPVVEDELMDYEDDAAIVVDDAPLDATASVDGEAEEDTEMGVETVAVVPELEMSEVAPEAETVIAPEVVLADAEVEEPEETEGITVLSSVPAELDTVEAEVVESVDVVPVQMNETTHDQVETTAETQVTSAELQASPEQPMGSEFFDYGHHDGSGDEAIHASGSEYYEEEEHEFDESEVVIQILIAFDNVQVPLFSPAEGDTSEREALLEGRADELSHAPLAELLDALRAECENDESKKDWVKAGEMCLEEENMGLYVGEDNHHAHSITLAQVIDLYRGCQIESPMILHISYVPDEDRFITRFKAIEREVLAQADKAGLEHDEVDELEGHVEEDAFEDPDSGGQAAEEQEQVAVPLPSEETTEDQEEDAHDGGRLGRVTGETEPDADDDVEAPKAGPEAEARAEVEAEAPVDADIQDGDEEAGEDDFEATEGDLETSVVVPTRPEATGDSNPIDVVDAHTSEEVMVRQNDKPEMAPNVEGSISDPIVQVHTPSSAEAQPVQAESTNVAEANQIQESAHAVGTAEHAGDDAIDGSDEPEPEDKVEVPEDLQSRPSNVDEAEPSMVNAGEGITQATADAGVEVTSGGPDGTLVHDTPGHTAVVQSTDDSAVEQLPDASVMPTPLSDEPITSTATEPAESAPEADEDEVSGDEEDQYGIDAVVNGAEKQIDADDAELDFAGGEVDDETIVGKVEESYEGDDIPDGVDVNDPEGDEVASHTSSRTISADEDPTAAAVDGALALAHSMLPIEEDATWPEDDAQDDDFYDHENEAEWQDHEADADADAGADADVPISEPAGFVAAAALVETRSRSPKRTLEEVDDGKAEREVRQKR